ncbi:hypothetical protein, partial [uncultured Desulfovibrio sp.]|uniref:hypothetical protein n=1 Tax=uncultured Desulfovibrio sp. TaxID=167968 RepID=UPI002635639C
MGGITNKTVHLSFAVDWSKEVNPLLQEGTRTIWKMNLSRMREKWFLVEHKGRLKGGQGKPGAVLAEKCESLKAL